MFFNPSRRVASIAPGGSQLATASAAAAPAALVDFPPHVYPPRGSRMIYLSGRANFAPAAIGDSVTPAGLTIQLPPGWAGVVRLVDLFANGVTVATLLNWQVLVNEVPAPGLAALTMQFRDAPSLSRTVDNVLVEIPENALVKLRIVSGDGLPYIVGGILQGWMYPASLGGSR